MQPPPPPTTSPSRASTPGLIIGLVIVLVVVVVLGGLSLAVFGTDTLFNRTAELAPGPADPPYATGRDVVPHRALHDAIMLTNEKGCQEGSIRHLAWAAKTTAGDATALMPNEGSLVSFSLPDSTAVYDIMLTGRCRMGGRPYTTIEALVFARPGQFPSIVVAGMEERLDVDPNSSQPFGEQWND